MSTPTVTYWPALAVAVAANVTANMALRLTMTSVPRAGLVATALHAAGRMSFWIAIGAAGILFVAYATAVRQVPASTAYVAVTSLAMVGLVIVEASLFNVVPSVTKGIGIAFVVVGVWMIGK